MKVFFCLVRRRDLESGYQRHHRFDVDPDVPSVKKTPAELALQPTLPLSLPEFKPWSGKSTTVWEKIGFSRANRQADCGRARLQSCQSMDEGGGFSHRRLAFPGCLASRMKVALWKAMRHRVTLCQVRIVHNRLPSRPRISTVFHVVVLRQLQIGTMDQKQSH